MKTEFPFFQAMLVSLNIVGSANINGAEIVGSNMVYNYEQVIRQVTYTNQKPAYYLNRQFKLACSQLNKRFVSNEFIETVRTEQVVCLSNKGGFDKC